MLETLVKGDEALMMTKPMLDAHPDEGLLRDCLRGFASGALAHIELMGVTASSGELLFGTTHPSCQKVGRPGSYVPRAGAQRSSQSASSVA